MGLMELRTRSQESIRNRGNTEVVSDTGMLVNMGQYPACVVDYLRPTHQFVIFLLILHPLEPMLN